MAKKEEKKFDYSIISEYLNSCVHADVQSYMEDDAFVCRYDNGTYTVQITFEELLDSVTYNYGFVYLNDERVYDLVDVLNVLDIKDFGDYSYIASMDNEKEIKQQIDKMLDTINKFSYDISKAGEYLYIDEMRANAEYDEILMNSKKLSMRKILRAAALQTNMQRTKTEKSKKAFLKEMKSRDAKGLLSVYDKRFVEYIEQGYPIPDLEDDNQGDYAGLVKKQGLSALICFAIGFVICFGIFFADRFILASKGIAVLDNISYLFVGFGSVLLSYVLYRLFNTKLTLALVPYDQREYAKEECKKDYSDENIIQRIWRKYVSLVIALVGVPVMLIVSTAAVCITPNEIIDHNLIANLSYSYDDVELYLVKGWTDDEDNYAEYDNPYYRVKSGDNEVDIGEVKDENQLKEIQQIFAEHNIVPVEVKE